MNRGLVALVVLGLVAGCGGTAGTVNASTRHTTTTVHRPSPKPTPTVDSASIAAANAAYKQCTTLARPMLTKLQALNSRLTVGMTQANYNVTLGNIQVTEDVETAAVKALPKGGLNLDCATKVLTPIIVGFTYYLRANQLWSTCINHSLTCNVTRDQLPQMRKFWNLGNAQVVKAAAALDALQPN